MTTPPITRPIPGEYYCPNCGTFIPGGTFSGHSNEWPDPETARCYGCGKYWSRSEATPRLNASEEST